MPSLCKRAWLSPAEGCSPAELCAWKKTAAPTLLDGFLGRLLGEASGAPLEMLERGRVLLLDGPALPPRAPPEGPVRLSLDLAGFSPEDVAVRLDGRRLQITAKRETENREPDGCCSRDYREVSREVLLPDDADLEAVSCALSDDGRLRIEAPRLPRERVVPIQRVDEAVGQGKRVLDGEEALAEKRRRLEKQK